MEYENAMCSLIKYVVKVFYEPQHFVFINILLDNIILTDEDACKALKLLSREFNRITMRLKEDKFIKIDQKLKAQDEGKDILQNAYYINFAEVRNIIKYKMSKMVEIIEKNTATQEDSFFCKNCNKKYSVLEAQSMMVEFVFRCSICKGELVESTIVVTKDEVDNKTFVNKMEHLIKLLKATEAYKIPNMDYFQLTEYKKERKIKQDIDKKEKMTMSEHHNFSEENEHQDTFFENPTDDSNKNDIKPVVDTLKIGSVDKKLHEITEKDIENMTEEEYLKYYELHESANK